MFTLSRRPLGIQEQRDEHANERLEAALGWGLLVRWNPISNQLRAPADRGLPLHWLSKVERERLFAEHLPAD
jgi:hypothetical protein